MNRDQIFKSFLNNINCIADKNYQKRVWIRGEGPECDDFDETVCNFFGDGDPIIENYRDFGIRPSQYCLFKKIHEAFEAFVDSEDRPYLPQDFIKTPEWTRITIMAKEVLIAFGWHNE